MTLQDLGDIAQVVIAIATGIGVLVALFVAATSLRELRLDRRLRRLPFLVFEQGSFHIPVEFRVAGAAVMGVEPYEALKAFGHLPADGESIRPAANVHRIGHLSNLGTGPALDVHVIWIPEEIQIGSDRIALDASKREEPAYSADFNEMPSSPRNLMPGDVAFLTRLPVFIEKDYQKRIGYAEGALRVEFRDVFGESHWLNQQFRLWPGYEEDPPAIGVTFGDVLSVRGSRRTGKIARLSKKMLKG